MRLGISKKFCKRSIKCLAMFAPLAYLFGSLFFGLNGDHAGKFLDDATSSVTPDYDYLMTPEHFSYGAFDWQKSEGYCHYGFSLGSFSISPDDDFDLWISANGIGLSYYTYGGISDVPADGGLGFSASSDILFRVNMYEWYDSVYIDMSESINPAEDGYFSFYYYDVENDCVLSVIVSLTYRADSFSWFIEDVSIYSITFDGTLVGPAGWSRVDNFGFLSENVTLFFDDGQNLPEGVEWNDELRSYFVPSVMPVESTSSTDYIFGQFFQKDNFLVQWGENSICDSPKGFAPFGTFIKYVDDNMLHLNDSQIGLMAYGYIYYCAHVLLAFLAFDCIVFIPKLIESVVSKFNGGMNDD